MSPHWLGVALRDLLSTANPDVTRTLNLAATLLLLFGVTYLSTTLNPPITGGGLLAVLIGFVLLVATVAGGLASQAGLPRLTGFLVVGILAGPSVLGILPSSALDELHLIDSFALALIAMLAGGELKVEALRPQARTILVTTVAVTVLVWVGMGATVLAIRPLVPFLAELSWAGMAGMAILLGVWAANSSPDLTVAVIEEVGRKDTFSDVLLGITIVKDVLVIVLFTLALSLVEPLLRAGEAEGFDLGVVLGLAQEVGGALVLGALLGWIFSIYLKGAPSRPPLATFLFAYVVVVIAERLHVELLLMGVSAGFVIENLSPAGDRMIRGIESVSIVIFAFFFTVAGASLDLGALRVFWAAALLLFTSRLLFTYLGARWGVSLTAPEDERVRTRLWQGLISQGGVTLGLVLLLQRSFPELGPGVVALAMAVILGNILGGPILLKRALVADGTGTAAAPGSAAEPGAVGAVDASRE